MLKTYLQKHTLILNSTTLILKRSPTQEVFFPTTTTTLLSNYLILQPGKQKKNELPK